MRERRRAKEKGRGVSPLSVFSLSLCVCVPLLLPSFLSHLSLSRSHFQCAVRRRFEEQHLPFTFPPALSCLFHSLVFPFLSFIFACSFVLLSVMWAVMRSEATDCNCRFLCFHFPLTPSFCSVYLSFGLFSPFSVFPSSSCRSSGRSSVTPSPP